LLGLTGRGGKACLAEEFEKFSVFPHEVYNDAVINEIVLGRIIRDGEINPVSFADLLNVIHVGMGQS